MFDLARASRLALASDGSRQVSVDVTQDDKTCTPGTRMGGIAIA